MRRKCGISPTNYLKKCPPLLRSKVPDTNDCQGCTWSIEIGRQPGYPTNKHPSEEPMPEVVE